MGYRIREFRENMGMTKERLADKSGISCELISALENGTERITTPETLFKLAEALGTSVDQISIQNPFWDKEPLLSSIGYKGLLELITPEDMQRAKFLLGQFLQDMRGQDNENVVLLSYLFGIKQNLSDMYKVDAAGKSFVGRMMEFYNKGKQHGFYEALLISGKMPSFNLKVSFGNKDGRPDGDEQEKRT